ncbi:nucleoside triphosphate pyrophosphohydrolase [Rhodobacteraceae bacterium KMM 6894]|nr:nucleoside triphosphate pyrophosphohydrolase [Rhodobacteraceae bacterium KMM 6894]
MTTCNRAKRASDEPDFRKQNKLVRDKIPAIIKTEGRTPKIKQLKGRALTSALYNKLTEEHANLLAATDTTSRLEELADMVEVILALASSYGTSDEELMNLVRTKREKRGGFSAGQFYAGDE